MSEREQNQPSGEPARVLRHDEWESLIADALDGTLTAADAAAFNRHHRECALCGQMLKETQQGKAWMRYLAMEPEAPGDLLKKILARTSERQPVAIAPEVGSGTGRGVASPALILPPRPAWRRVMLPAVRHLLEPRLMMTAAMAFFSIALTLNLAGVKLSQLRPSDLEPSRLRANLTRQYYSTNEQVTKYYENLRLVYEMEARVRELKRSSEPEPAPSPRETPKQPPRDGTGSPSSTVPRGQIPPVPSTVPATLPDDRRSHRDQVLPALVIPAGFEPAGGRRKFQEEVFRASRATTEDQTRISRHHAALDMATCAALVKESRMRFANATEFLRKSGVAQRSLV